MIHQIDVLDAVWCSCDLELYEFLREKLSFKETIYIEGAFHKEPKEVTRYVTTKKGKKKGWFYTGLLPRALREMSETDMVWDLNYLAKRPDQFSIDLPSPVKLPGGGTFEGLREDQLTQLEVSLNARRGVIQGVTGVGKSMLITATIASYDCPVLVLFDSTDILKQYTQDARSFGFDYGLYTGQRKNFTNQRICIATRQAFAKVAKGYSDRFQVVIVDEAHRGFDFEGQYHDILCNLKAATDRYGFTATPPKNPRDAMALEALIGGVVTSMSMREATVQEIIAKPNICIRKVPFSQHIRSLKKYEEAYVEGVVQRVDSNEMKADDAARLVNEGFTVLALVSRVEHGEILQALMRERLKTFVPFVWGQLTTEARDNLRYAMINKKLRYAIANVVWATGINIPTLDVIQNAASGKDEIGVLQGWGRTVRKTDGKSESLLLDYFDSSNYHLVRHFGERISTYMEHGWEFMTLDMFIERNKR